MKIVEKIVKKQNDNHGCPSPCIAFLGDSVTQGCFEIYRKSEKEIQTVFDKNSAYHNYLAQIFSVICPSVPVNIINAGISGGSAPHALERIERDVLVHNPDLVVVCFGLNDCGQGVEKVSLYTDALGKIFDKIKESGAEIIFMTPNMMITHVSCHVTDDLCKEIAEACAVRQIDGVLECYIDEAIKLCNEKGVTVCDCYKKWKKLSDAGINTTELLSNKINHPTRDMNWLFAYSLFETIFEF